MITGRICSTFQVPKLLELREKLDMYNIKDKKGIDFICTDLELYFRYKNITQNNFIYFEENILKE